MYVNGLLRKVDMEIDYYEHFNFYKDMSRIEDMDYFAKVMQLNEGHSIENGIICMSLKENKKDFEKVFLEKYHKYLIKVLEVDSRKYYNNQYCNYIYNNSSSKLTSDDELKKEKFLNGKSFFEIEELLVEKYNEISERLQRDEELDDEDREFLVETFLSMAFYYRVYKEIDGEKDLMYDIVKYFDKYPIEDINTPRNKQLELLYILSKKLLKISGNSAILFQNKENDSILGSFVNEDGVDIICINNLDIYDLRTEKDFLKRIFTIFHELGHLTQNREFEDYRDDIKEVMLLEKSIVKDDREFYKEYHDSFFLERDADNYATIEFIKEFGKKYPIIVSNIVDFIQSKKRINMEEFYLMEQERYNKRGSTTRK